MSISADVRPARSRGPSAFAACRILASGAHDADRREIENVVRAILESKIPEIARDRNAICYRASLPGKDAASFPVIVKAPRPGDQRTNADATFGGEARVLERLPAEGIERAPALVAHVAAAGTHFLFTTELPGKHPHPHRHPLGRTQLRALADALYRLDRVGFMHYDLKAANILLDGDNAAFVDFEFARFGDPWDDRAAAAGFGEDFNVANNPFVVARSNVANFEFRALDRYLDDLETVNPAGARTLFREWLSARSAYHARMAECLAQRAHLRPASLFERELATLLEDANEAVVAVERALIAFRTAVFERRGPDAARARRSVLATIANSRNRTLPPQFAAAARRVLSLVSRSSHPTAAL